LSHSRAGLSQPEPR